MYKFKVIKSTNYERILECIYRNPGISRKDISDITGITPATVTTTVSSMTKEGIVTELGQMEEDRGTIGRSRIALGICAGYGCTIGVECTLTSLSVCAADLHGQVLYASSIPYTSELADNITQRIIDSVRQCMEHVAFPEEKIMGIGIALPGHIDHMGRRMISSNEKWGDFDGHKIQAAFSCPVVFENNIRCMAVAQYLHSPQNTPCSFALFHVGLGMFCANVTEDGLYIGTTYGSGEIGHTIAVPNGKRCECGKRGCLQTVATEPALLENAAFIFDNGGASMLRSFAKCSADLTIDHLTAAYTLGDPAIRQIVTQALQYLCISTLNIAILMNPEKLFLHGRLFNNKDIRQDFLEMVHKQFDFTRNNYRLGTVEFLECSPSDGALGGAALAILKCVIHA